MFKRIVWILGMIGLLSAIPVHAQGQDVVWDVAYYSNAYMIGDATFTENLRGNITLDWNLSAPNGLPTDYFSLRLGTNTYFNAGTWRFSVLADDGVTVRVDGQKIIDTFEAGSPAQNLVADVTLSEGFHTIQVDYREAEGAAYLYVSWDRAGALINPAPFPQPSSAEATRGRWLAEFYNNTTLSEPRVFANDTPSPVANWGYDAPVPQVNADAWSARFTTRIYLEAGRYRATLSADDGVRYYVDGVLLLDQFGAAAGRAFSVEFDVGGGEHDIKIEHVEYGGTASLSYTLARITTTQATPYLGADPVPQPVTGSAATTNNPVVPPPPAPTAVPAPVVSNASAASDVTATITAYYVNVRSEPRVARGNIVSTVSEGQVFPVTGRANNGWVQIEVNGVRGWINGTYASTPNLLTIPISAQGPTS